MSLLGRKLTESEESELDELARARSAEHRLVQRAQIVLMASRSRHICEVVRALHSERHVVRLWCNRFLEDGINGLRDHPRSGHPRRYNAEQRATVVMCALTSPKELDLPFGEWTLVRLSDYLNEHKDLPMSPTRVGVVLREEGLRWQRQEKWLTCKATIDAAFVEKRGPSSKHTRHHQKAV